MTQAQLARLATAVIQQAVVDLDHGNAFIREYAEDFLFGDDEVPLLMWLVRTGCTDIDGFRDDLLRKSRVRKKIAA